MVYLAAILVYLLILTGIGIYKSRQVKTQDDFSVAGRTLSPWVMVLTMLAVWIGTGSIVGNAEEAYRTGMAALIIPLGTFLGMILLSLIATRARNIEALSVPEIIGSRFGLVARFLAVIALITAYMVIVSYQFNAGGAVLEVITGDKNPVPINIGDTITRRQLTKGRLVFTPAQDFEGQVLLSVQPEGAEQAFDYLIQVVPPEELIEATKAAEDRKNIAVIKNDAISRIRYTFDSKSPQTFLIKKLPNNGKIELLEPKLTKENATIIAALFIIAYTMLAGLKSLAGMDIVTGSIITISLLIAFPVLLIKAGGFDGMRAAYETMQNRPSHMQFWGVYSPIHIINYLLPTFLLVMGDANQYQRIFASRNARGAKQAVMVLIFVALVIELLIIGSAWIAGSMTPDPENGKYILIYAARHHMPFALGILFMVTVVGVIISTADSFLLVPATCFINDVYSAYINPKAEQKKVIFISRILVVVFGVIAYLVTHAFAETTGFFKKALYAYTIYGSAITPCLVAALFWKGATKAGAISSILAGTITTLLWGEVIKDLIKDHLSAQIAELDAVLPAITLSVICLIVVSILTRKKTTGSE
ncbi:MAG: sodium:solute symporter family protein [Sedimentisphaerales bacterium]|nr:sodium:solute symporter family protein [Sedimentisphaerales bacterium]